MKNTAKVYRENSVFSLHHNLITNFTINNKRTLKVIRVCRSFVGHGVSFIFSLPTMQPAFTPPLTNVQRELLSLFAKNIPENHLVELRGMIARFLLEKAMDKADAVWDERGYTAETMQELLREQHS